MTKRFGVHTVLFLLASLLAMSSAFAQTTTAALSGRVTDAAGNPVAGASVRIVHVPSGTASSTTTDANGRYIAQGLRVGGPYHVEATGNGIKEIDADNIYIELGQVATANLAAAAANATKLEGVTVTASALDSTFNSDNKGLGTSISGRALETAVSGNRSLDDIARLDPRITVTDQNDGSISLAGQNNRYNNISVDGLSVRDPFGLNANGLGFTGSPISPDTIAAYEIKATDYDTAFDSVGANINAVTKSGTNEFHGSVYGAYTNGSSMIGESRAGADYTGFDQNKTYGFTLGGPIIKDKLFFFLGYEDQKVTGIQGVGTDAVSSGGLTQAQVDAVTQAFKSIGIDPGTNGGGGSGLTQEDKRSLAKLDWNISDSQRASFTYQRTEETKPTPYSAYVKATSVILSSDFYTVASKTDNYSLQLFSDWTDNFSTEFKLGYQKFDNTNGAAENQPEVYACFTATAANCPNYAGNIPSTTDWVIAGEDRYRAENAINSKILNGTLAGTWHMGDHVIKGGFDYMSNKTADIFGQLLHGSYGFYDKNGNGTPADEIAAGDYGTFVKNYLPTGVTLADSAGTWKYTQISPFLQDTWQATDRFSLIYGLRIDMPDADHAPPVAVESATNTAPGATPGAPVWQSRFGYPSNTALGSRNSVVEPRVAFNYTFDTSLRMQLHGGVGLFQSTPPTVWLSNPYVNNGVVSAKQYTNTNPANAPFSPDPNNQPGPTSVQAGVCATNATCQIDVIDPNFKLPTSLKFNLAFDSELPWWGLIGSVEDMFIKSQDAIAYIAPNIGTPNGTMPDGRTSYWKTAGTTGSGTNFGAYPEINTRSTELTNTSQGFSNALTFALSKPWDNGLSGTVSATFTHATDVNPGTSSQAYSNYDYYARINPNDLVSGNSRFNIPLSFKAALNWDHAFFGDNKTTASLFYNGHSGLPYSWTFGNDINGDGLPANTDLAYIPLKNDPLVSYGTATQAQIDAFNAYIDSDSYLSKHRGQIAGRNAANSPWVNQLDLGLQQELPGFFGKDKFVVRMDIFNFLNLLNKKWGDVDNAGFFGTRYLVSSATAANGQYVYNLSKPPQGYTLYDSYTNPARVVSRWQLLLTLKYKF